jgi:serine protease Do
MDTRFTRAAFTFGLALAIGAGCYAADRMAGHAEATSPPPAVAERGPAGLPRSFAPLVAEVAPAVVHIKVVSVQPAANMGGGMPFPPEWFGEGGPFEGMPFPQAPQGGMRQEGAGSGFVIGADGVIVTNNHVVERAKEISVTTSDGHEYTAKVLGTDPKTDLAVLKIEPRGKLPVARLGDSDNLAVGDWVLAIGNPFGLNNSVTLGIVSAKSRAIGAGPYDDFIQTDASINPGNSGGPLLDSEGRVIGINTAIFSRSGGNMGIGFAIPVNLAKHLVPQLQKDGHVTRGWLGVTVQPLTPQLAESLGLDEESKGALVAAVQPKSPAAIGGLRRGDVIVAFDGKDVDETRTLPELVADSPIGERVGVTVIRDGKTQELTVEIRKMDDEPERRAALDGENKGKLGLALRELSPEERKQRDLNEGGAMIANVRPDGPAAEAMLQPGDVILEVNRKPVASPSDVGEAVSATPDGKSVLMLVRPKDGGGDRFLTVPVG